MASAQDTYGTVFKNGAAILLARVVGTDGSPLVASDASALQYSVLELDECRPDQQTAIDGHDDVTLSIGESIFDTLQTDSLWTLDATGYNFRHEIDVSSDEAFPKAGVSYQVRYQLTPVSGQKVVFRFHMRAI